MMKRLFLLILFLFLVGCSSYQAFRQGEKAENEENYDRAVVKYMEALAKDPKNVRFKIYLERVRLRASQAHFERAKKLNEAGRLQSAIQEYEMAVQLDPTNQFAQVELTKARKAWRKKNKSLTDLEKLKEKAMKESGQPPKLNPKSSEPMSFSFPKPTDVKDIYQALAKGFGFNVIFDPQVKEKKITLELRDVSPRKALEITMRAGGHFYKVLDESTIIIAPDTPQMRKQYEDLLIQTFYLSNADVKDVNNILRSIMQARNVATNKQLNAVVIRDTADKVAIAKKIIDANDKAKAEVIIDVELLQVDSSKFKEIGSELSSYSYTLGYTGGGDNGLPLDEIKNIKRGDWSMAIPSITLNFIKNASEAQLLAKPQLRISEGEKAQLHIGDRIPIATAQYQGYNQTQNTAGYIPYTSYQYTDVGIKIDIEPRVHHNREVTLKLKVEVSSAQPSSGGDNYLPPTISTRKIGSVIRLKDGETNLLAGLIRKDTSRSKSGFPWLQDIPLIGALFSSNNRNMKQTDLILTLTPHIVRMPNITEDDLLPVWVGTERNMSIRGGSTRVESGKRGPFDRSGSSSSRKSTSPRSHGNRPFGNLRGGKGRPNSLGGRGHHPRTRSAEPTPPSFYFQKPPAGGETEGSTFILHGSYGEDQRMVSLLVRVDGASWQEAKGLHDVEVVVNEVSDTTYRLDLILPHPSPKDGALAKVTLQPAEGHKTGLTILKGGARDAKNYIWPITADSVSLP